MSEWYYADRNRQQHGPVSADVLVTQYRFGRITLDSLVWREGLPQWLPLRDFADELGVLAAPQPAEAAPVPTPPPVPAPPSVLRATGQERLLRTAPPVEKKGMSGGKIALIVAAALVLPCIGIGGILAAIAIPAYQDYTLRAKAAQAITAAEPLKLAVTDFHSRQGRCPRNGEGDVGAPESYASAYVSQATVGEFDDGTCGFELQLANTGNLRLDGKKIWWELDASGGQWICSSEIEDKWLPANCRG